MTHPHGAMFLVSAVPPPSLTEVTLTEWQTGSEDGGACVDPHVERISYTVANGGQGGYTITTQIRVANGADPTGAYSNVETGKAASSGTSDFSEASPVNASGAI